jgi:hypothetical protein
VRNVIGHRSVLSSATEAETATLLFDGKEGANLHTTLAGMGHPQSTTRIQTGNTCAADIANDTVKLRRFKVVDMRFN